MVKYVQPVPRRSADGATAIVYEGLRREFGIHAEPIVLHSPAPPLLAGIWSVCRETLIAGTAVDRATKEAVAIEVSRLNECPFCVDAHSAMLAGSDRRFVRREVLDWARATRTPDARILADPPFSPDEAPELIGTAVLFHYINRPVTVFLDESPLPAVRKLSRRGTLWLAGRRFRRFVRTRPEPGTTIARSWAQFGAAADAAAEAALAPGVRARVAEALARWDGSDPGFGSGWLEELLEPLAARERAAGRLALLTALAPYRVDKRIVAAAVEEARWNDGQLVAAVSWPALAAARRVSEWLRSPVEARS